MIWFVGKSFPSNDTAAETQSDAGILNPAKNQLDEEFLLLHNFLQLHKRDHFLQLHKRDRIQRDLVAASVLISPLKDALCGRANA